MIRITEPSVEDDDVAAVVQVLRSGYLVQGQQVRRFEDRVARIAGASQGVAVASGTAALHLALLSLGTRAGDLVLVPTYSWVATANVIELVGATPVFVDIERDSYGMDPDALQRTLSRCVAALLPGQRIRAVLVVHAFGLMADVRSISEVAAQYDVPLIEDAACALGAEADGRSAGAWGVLGCFSFHPRKAVTTGEGGAVTCASDALARSVRALRNHGLDPDASGPDFVLPGLNYRMTEFQGALGVTQLDKLDRILLARRQRASVYGELLAETAVAAPVAPSGREHTFQSYVVRLPAGGPSSASLIPAMRDRGVEATIGTCHIPMTTYYRNRYNFKPGDFPVTDDIASRALTLPLHERLTAEEQRFVVDTLVGLLA